MTTLTATRGKRELRQLFGRVISTDFPLPRLPVARTRQTPSVEIRRSGPFCARELPSPFGNDRFRRELHRDGIHYLAGGIGEFTIHEGGRMISYRLVEGAPDEDVQHVLTGPAMVMALQLQGEFMLHAAGVEIDGAVVAMAAPHGFGKSTFASYLMDQGYNVLADDVVTLSERDGGVLAGEGQPWLKLWESSLAAFGRDPNDFDEVMRGFGKRMVPRRSGPDGELPLRAVYLLAPATGSIPVSVRRLGRADAGLAILANAYSCELLTRERELRALAFASTVADTVPVSAITYQRTFQALPSILDAIVQHVEEHDDVGR